jgi:hypothetical protein
MYVSERGESAMKRRKAFDCVEMKRKAQEKIYEETKHLSRDGLVEYFHCQVEAGPFAQLWKGSRKMRLTTRNVRNC